MTTKDVLIQFEDDFWNAEGNTFLASESAKDKVRDFLITSISKLLDEVVEACEEEKKLARTDVNGFPIWHVDVFNQGLSTAIEIINSKR